jgi:hypothetical protein
MVEYFAFSSGLVGEEQLQPGEHSMSRAMSGSV